MSKLARVSKLAPLWASAATLATPVLRLNLQRRASRGKEVAGRLGERRGIDATPRRPGPLIWVHAASVGESVSVLPVLSALDRLGVAVLLTTGTVTSATLMEERIESLGLTRTLHRFAPLDIPRWSARFLDHWRPNVAAFVESELWPNLLAACRSRGIPMMLVNARLSARSFGRWRRAPGFAAHTLGHFDLVQAQSEPDAERLVALGARRVSVPGNLKLAAPALPVDQVELKRLRSVLGPRPCWVAASTHPGEEAIALEAHRRLTRSWPGLLTVLVPRHPERAAEVAALAEGINVSRRSLGAPAPAEGVWIADTIGELGLWYRLAGAALIGKSLFKPGGGQNPLEPARLGCPIAAGPFMANFADAVRGLEAAGALSRIADASELTAWLDALLRDPARRAAGVAAGLAAAQGYEHLTEAPVAALLDLLARKPA